MIEMMFMTGKIYPADAAGCSRSVEINYIYRSNKKKILKQSPCKVYQSYLANSRSQRQLFVWLDWVSMRAVPAVLWHLSTVKLTPVNELRAEIISSSGEEPYHGDWPQCSMLQSCRVNEPESLVSLFTGTGMVWYSRV